MTAARLPIPGEDSGTWGDILNAFLMVDHNADGTLRSEGTLSTKANDGDTVHITGAEIIGGSKTFTAPITVPAPTQNFHASTKAYVDSAVAAGGPTAPDASNATKGIVRLSGDLGGTADTPTVPGLATKANVADLSDVAISGAYADLSGRPTLSTVAVTGVYADLTGKPSLSTVAISGDYNDLTGKPTIPDVSGFVSTNDARLTDTRIPSDNSVSAAKLQDASVNEAKLNISNSPTNGHFLAWDGTDLAWQAQASAPVSSVAGQTGVVTLSKNDVGLGNVDNTTDANKPVSSATQTALDAKLSKGGDTMTGALTLPGDPTNPNHAATKSYVDSQSAGTQQLVIGTTEPTPSVGQQVLWLDTTGGNVTLNLVTGE